jgi:hypothetical protein
VWFVEGCASRPESLRRANAELAARAAVLGPWAAPAAGGGVGPGGGGSGDSRGDWWAALADAEVAGVARRLKALNRRARAVSGSPAPGGRASSGVERLRPLGPASAPRRPLRERAHPLPRATPVLAPALFSPRSSMEIVCEQLLPGGLAHLDPLGALLDRARGWGDGGAAAAAATTPACMGGGALLGSFVDGVLCQVCGCVCMVVCV